MIRPRLEVAEVFREFTPAFFEKYGDTISPDQRQVLRDLARCRTAELGGHVKECDRCAGFMRIRHFGFLANRQRAEKLELCRRLLGVEQSPDTEAAARPAMAQGAIEAAVAPNVCPACKEGRMVIIEELERQHTKAASPAAARSPLTTDTS